MMSGNSVTPALTALQTTLADPKATQEEIKQKVEDVRAARKKAQTDLDAAEKDLKLLLTPTQQATLIAEGILD